MRPKSKFARSVRPYAVLLLALACKDHPTAPGQAVATPSGATTTITAIPSSLTAGGTSNIVVLAKDTANANIGAGGAAVALSTDAGTLSAVTDAGLGIYTATITGTVARDVHVTGTINGEAIAHGATVTFTAGAAAAIAKNAGDAQTGTVGTALGVAPAVTITDANGNPVAGVAVTFAVASGGGSVTNGTQTTNASGIATLGGWTLGLAVGVNTLTATANTLTATFTAIGTAGAVTHFAVTAVGGGTIPAQTAGTSFNVQVTALDANNNTATSFASAAVLTSTGMLSGAPLTTAAFVNGVLASQAVTITNSGSFTLTATNGATTGSSSAFTVVGGAVTHFAVTAVGGGAIPAQTAGTSFNVQITALDVNNNTAASFTGGGSTAVITSTGTLTGTPMTTAVFTNGVLASQAVMITNTGTFTLTAARTGGAETGSSAAFAVAAGAVTHFAVAAVGGGVIPAQTAGTPFNVQVTALDANNNTATAFTGTAVVTSTGTLTGAPLTTAAFINGVLASQAVTITNAGSFTLTATNGTTSGASAGFTVVGGAATHFAVTAVGGGAIPAETAGAPFNLQIVALDANGNTATSFANTVILTSTGTLTGAPLTTSAFTSGVLAAQAVTITNAGSFTLTATNGATTGSSAAFTVTAGGATHFAIAAVSGGVIPQQVAGSPFNIQLIALDANGNTATAFAGTAVLTSTGALSGAPVTTAAFVNGVLASQAVTVTNVGNFTLTATNGATSGSSAAFTVAAGAATHFAVTAIGGGSVAQQTAGTPFNIQITALDANGNTATAFASTAVLTSTGTLTGAPVTTSAFTSGVLAAQAVTITNTGSFTLTATSGATTGSSAAFTVGGGAVTHFSVTAVGGGAIPQQTAGTPFTVQLTALDGSGNIATAFSGVGSTAVLTSTGALTGAPLTTAAFTNGVLASQAVTITNTGSFTLTAARTGGTETGISATFTTTAGAAATLTVSGDNQTATVNTAVAFAPSAKIVDANNNPIQGLTVTFTPVNGSISPAVGTVTTNALGVASLTSWTLGSVAGAQSLAVSAAGLASVTIHATATASAPATIQRSGSLVLSTVVGTPLPSYPAVRLLDLTGNPVPSSSGGSTTFSVISGSCSTPGGLTPTDAGGIAALSSSTLTLPPVAGSCLVRATSPSLSGSPIDFDIVVGPSTGVYTWLGATSSDITVASNWSGPTATPSGSTASIFIPTTVPSSPNLTAASPTTLAAATLEAGAGLTVSTNVLTLTGTVAAGAGSTITIFSGATVLFQGATTTLGNLTVNSGTASFSHNATVSGALSALNSAVVTHTASGLTLTVAGTLTSSSGTTLSGLKTVAFTGSTFPAYGNATTAGVPLVTQISHDMSVPSGASSFVNNLTVSDAALSVNGNGTTLTVGTDLDVKSSTGAAGEILMNSGDPTLVVTGNATFRGKSQSGQGLTAGTLDLRGDFTQQDRTTGSHGEFEPGPAPFLVKFTGGGSAQNVSFAHPGTSPGTESYFTNVLVTNQGGVTQQTNVDVNGGTMTVGGPPADALSPAIWATGFGNSSLFITGGSALAVLQSGSFTVTSGGSLDLSGGSCTQFQAGLVTGNVIGGTCTVDSGLIGSIDNPFRMRIVGFR